MLKSKTNEKGRGLTDFEFDHISDEGDATAAELAYRKKNGKNPISDDIRPHLKKYLFGEASAAADARRAISKDRDFGRKRDSADKDDVASDDDVKAASKNIMMQLRKSVNRASRGVEFGDKKKVQSFSKNCTSSNIKIQLFKASI